MDSSAGGFLSPPPSSVASSNVSSNAHLPHPRKTPLRIGGSKESTFIRHMDAQVLRLQRRYAKRTVFSTNDLVDGSKPQVEELWPGDEPGYSSMKQACKDTEKLVDLVWLSGTPSLQVPYLINLASFLATVVNGMPPSPRSLFHVLGKLDRAFAGLLQGRDVETGEPLPGFEGKRGLSGTEKVRIRSLVERARVGAIEAFNRAEFDFEDPDEDRAVVATDSGTDGELVLEGDDFDHGEEEEEESWDMQLAKVYDLTIVELGHSLDAFIAGIP